MMGVQCPIMLDQYMYITGPMLGVFTYASATTFVSADLKAQVVLQSCHRRHAGGSPCRKHNIKRQLLSNWKDAVI